MAKRKPKKAPNNPERFSTMPQGKRLHRSEEKRMRQPKRVIKTHGSTKTKPKGSVPKNGLKKVLKALSPRKKK